MNIRTSAIVLASLLVASSAFAQGAGGAAKSGGSSSGPFELFMGSGMVSIAGSASAFDLSPGLGFKILPSWDWLQVGGELTYQKLSHQGGGTKSMVIMGGPTVNLGGSSINDAVFISLGIAMRSGSTDLPDSAADNPNGMGYYFIAGKRFPLSGGWCFRPSLGVVNTGTSGMVFRPLAISYHF